MGVMQGGCEGHDGVEDAFRPLSRPLVVRSARYMPDMIMSLSRQVHVRGWAECPEDVGLQFKVFTLSCEDSSTLSRETWLALEDHERVPRGSYVVLVQGCNPSVERVCSLLKNATQLKQMLLPVLPCGELQYVHL